MVIDLKKIFVNENSSMPLEYSMDMSTCEYMGLYPLKKPVTLKGTVSNSASLIKLAAVISYEYDAPCDRCGKPTAAAVNLKLDKALASSIEGDDSDSILVTPDMKLDLDELLYTEVYGSLPMKHLCHSECKGICFKCGKDLNDGKCNCPDKEVDPRLAALMELLEN